MLLRGESVPGGRPKAGDAILLANPPQVAERTPHDWPLLAANNDMAGTVQIDSLIAGLSNTFMI
jgi:hypothetical protein